MAIIRNALLVAFSLFFLSAVSPQTVARKPCKLIRSIEAAREIMKKTIIKGGFSLDLPRLNAFNVDPVTLKKNFEIQSHRSACPVEGGNAGARQFCREKMHLDVDLAREPVVIFNANCGVPCSAASRLINFKCVPRGGFVKVMHRLCEQSGNRTISEAIQTSYLVVKAGCQLKCKNGTC